MTALIDAAFSRTRVVLTAFIFMILFGYSAFVNIPREAEPDINAPFVFVTLPLPGISPEDGERLLVRPTELELQTIDGLKQIDSLAFDGAARIILEFKTSVDIDKAVLDVREAVDRAKSKFPSTAEEPIVRELNLQNQFPIISIILSGDAPERALFQVARRLKDRLEGVPGVLEANMTGAREELLEVILKPEILESYGLTEIEVANAVVSNNQLVAAGSIQTADGRFAVKAPGVVKTAADLMAIPVRASGDNVVTIGDLAEVRRTFVDREGYALFNGAPAIGIDLSKRAGSNIIDTIEAARAAVAEEAKFWPASIRHSFVSDQSTVVRDNLDGLTASVITAVVLVMIVIVAALGLRSALLVGISIPSTFLIGFLLLSLFGYSLNMMVMFGLVLAVGMLVDGAIVVIEYADRRMLEGADRQTAYFEAARRMFWPVVASTATTIAAFAPFMFWEDTAGEFMKYLPLTLIFVLTTSLFVALIFLPVVGSLFGIPAWMKRRFGIKGKTDAPQGVDLDDADPLTLPGLSGRYARFLSETIRRPLLVLGVAGGAIFLCFSVFRAVSPDVEYFIRSDDEQINLLVLGRGNLSAEQTLAAAQEVARRVEGHPAIENIYLQTGPELSRGRNQPAETIAIVGVDLLKYSEREHSRLVVRQLRDLTQGVPGVYVEARQREGGPPIGKDVQVEVTSASFDAMLRAARQLRAYVNDARMTVNGVEVHTYMDQEDTLPLPGIEWSMEVDRALAGRYGLSVQQAGAVLQLVTDGLLVDKYRPDDSEEEVDIRVRWPRENRSVLALDQIRVQTPQGAVPLSNFVTREARPQVDRIIRRDGRRIIEIKANANSANAAHAVSQDVAIADMRAFLESGALGPDVSWSLLGANEETAEAAAFFGAAMGAAMFMIALILLMQFNSFYHSALTLSAVVFSVFGVLLGVAVSGQYFSIIMTGVGIVALAGIVVNNNIVLIDTFQFLRRRGLTVEDAVVRTAVQRARPVLLTTGTTILGLLPMVFELNVNFATGQITRGSSTSDWWVLLSSAIVYGLAFSTFLTLLLTPALLAAPTVLKKRFERRPRIPVPGARPSTPLAAPQREPVRRAAE